MKSRLKNLAANTARRTMAAERVALRRWLRKEAARRGVAMPDHQHLLFDVDQLCDEVRKFNGDPTTIRREARSRVVTILLGGE